MSHNWTWGELREKVGCTCQMSDAWRCQTFKRAQGQGCYTRQIACYCECHHYATTAKPGASPTPEQGAQPGTALTEKGDQGAQPDTGSHPKV